MADGEQTRSEQGDVDPALLDALGSAFRASALPGEDENFDDEACRAAAAFTLNTAAYTTEFLRGAIEATPHGEVEAAKACGMSPFTRMRLVVLPNAFRRALPAYSNEVIFTLHGSVIASTVTLQDLLGVGRWLNGRYYLAYEGFLTAMVFYMAIVFLITFVFRMAEKRFLGHLRPRETPAPGSARVAA